MKSGWLFAMLVSTALGGIAETLDDFGFRAVPLPASRPVLVILPIYPGLTPIGTSLQWHELVLGSVTSDSPPRYSVANWAAETSNGRFRFTSASLATALNMTAADSYDAIASAHPEWGGNDSKINYVWIARIVREMIDSGFNFASFDANGNGTVECPNELTICIVNPAKDNNGGVNRGFEPQRGAGSVSVSGSSIVVGHLAQFDTILHEFGHSFGIPYEMYTFNPDFPAVNAGMTIMSVSGYGDAGAINVFTPAWMASRLHLDPYHKFRFGWSEPRLVSMRAGGRFVIPVATSGVVDAPIILYDPTHGTHEYFILEYRSRFQSNPNYDANFAVEKSFLGEGLVIWQVTTKADHSVFDGWTPADPALNPPDRYSSSIMTRCPPDLNVNDLRPWSGGTETRPLRWFDGTATSTRVRVLPFQSRATQITIEIIVDDPIWVDFSYVGFPPLPETGAFATPFNTLSEGIDRVGYGGQLWIKAGRTGESLARVNKPMRIQSFGGSAIIGR